MTLFFCSTHTWKVHKSFNFHDTAVNYVDTKEIWGKKRVLLHTLSSKKVLNRGIWSEGKLEKVSSFFCRLKSIQNQLTQQLKNFQVAAPSPLPRKIIEHLSPFKQLILALASFFSQVAGNYQRCFVSYFAVGFSPLCHCRLWMERAYSPHCAPTQWAKRRSHGIKANYWPANSVNCEGGLLSHCVKRLLNAVNWYYTIKQWVRFQ